MSHTAERSREHEVAKAGESRGGEAREPRHHEEADPITNAQLGQAKRDYLAWCVRERRLNGKTVRAYRFDIGQYLTWAEEGSAPFSRLSMRAYLAHLNETYSPSSVRRKFAALRAWANWMLREEYLYA